MKNYMRNNKGITITTLVVTVIIMLILSSTIIMKISDSKDVSKLNNLYADIKILEDKVLEYYNDYGTLPIKGEPKAPLLSMENGNKYYEVYNDKEISQIAWSKYGFRTGVTGGNYDVSQVNVSGIPQSIDSTVTSLKMNMYEKLISYLGE